MINMYPVVIEGKQFTAVTINFPKTYFSAVTNEKGYIMCGALDVDILNKKKERGIIAGRALGVTTIEQLLEAPLESITDEAKKLGIAAGMKGKDALLLMAED